MKPWILSLLMFSVAAQAQTDASLREWERDPAARLHDPKHVMRDSPKLDPKRIINESNSFLKEKEPEMTAEEYALYEKVVTMMATKPDLAIRLLEGMINDKEAPSPAFQFILGNAYYSAGQNDTAEKLYRLSVDRYPTFLRAWNNLGILYHTTQRYAQSAACFSKCVVLGDRDANTFGLLGYALEQEGNIVSAEMAYMQALSGAPDNPDWKEGLLRIYIRGRQFGRAEYVVSALIKEKPKDTRYWLTYANVLVSDNRKLQAIAVLESAVAVGAADNDSLGLLGDLYTEQKLSSEAIAIYEKLLAVSPEQGERRLLRYAQALISSGKGSDAERILNNLKPESLSEAARLNVLQLKADLLVLRKEWEKARAVLQSLLQISPLNGPALITLGHTYAAEENFARAQLAFESAYEISTSTYRASLELANLEIRNRHYAKAVEYLEKALSIEKTDAVADYLARIKALVVKES